MAELSYIIPESNLEEIRDQIAIIIKTELDNQAVLQTDDDLTGKVFIERFTPVNKSEGTVINVYINQSEFSQQTQVTQRGTAIFYIDFYCWDEQIVSEEGYFRTARKLHRLVMLVHNILHAPQFNKLTFDAGVVYNRTVTRVQFDSPANNADLNYARMGRLTLSIDFHNQQPHEVPITASGYDTTVKLDTSEEGYTFINDN